MSDRVGGTIQIYVHLDAYIYTVRACVCACLCTCTNAQGQKRYLCRSYMILLILTYNGPPLAGLGSQNSGRGYKPRFDQSTLTENLVGITGGGTPPHAGPDASMLRCLLRLKCGGCGTARDSNKTTIPSEDRGSQHGSRVRGMKGYGPRLGAGGPCDDQGPLVIIPWGPFRPCPSSNASR
jgi:hypothetical protein